MVGLLSPGANPTAVNNIITIIIIIIIIILIIISTRGLACCQKTGVSHSGEYDSCYLLGCDAV
jgi:hypothetical protein